MEFDEVLKNRFSVREFKDQPVENEKLEKITETARMAPSGVNFQPYKIGVFKKCDEFKDLFMQENFHDAPAAIGIAINYDEGFEMPDGNNLADIDVGILASYIALEATNQGLGSCIIASFNKDIAREMMGLDEKYNPILFIPMGYKNCEKPPMVRKDLKDLVI